MPIYIYRCHKCRKMFEELFLSFEQAEQQTVKCPDCKVVASRDFSTQRFNAPSNPFASELSEDSEEFREMHYYEKKKDWEKAAKAAEGVSDFAKNKFLQKAQQGSSKT